MLDPIHVTISDVTSTDDGLSVACSWQWGSAEPRALRVSLDERPDSADDVREVVTRWVLADAEFEYLLAPVRDELLHDGWTIEFEDDEDPFEATRVEESIGFMLRRAAREERES